MEWGLNENTILRLRCVFENYPEIEVVILYGSRAKGNFRPNSDIDLVLTGKNIDLSLQLKIESELDDLLLPYKIDLAILHKIENQDLVEHINRAGVVFYKKALH